MPELNLTNLPDKTRPLFNFNREHKRYIVLRGGRGSAKSMSVALYIVLRMLKGKEFVVCAREVQDSIEDSVHRTLVDVIEMYGVEDYFEIKKRWIICKHTGAKAVFKGLWRNPSAIKSLRGCTILWIEEAAAVSTESWTKVRPTVREDNSVILLTYNPEFRDDAVDAFFRNEEAKRNAIIIEMNWRDNPFWNEASEIERQIVLKDDPYHYEHIYEGAYLEDMHNPLALFTMQTIEDNRVDGFDIEKAQRVVIGIDPAGSTNKNSDETGIMVAASNSDKHGYVLEDASGMYVPDDWAAKSIRLYDEYKADTIVAEKNFGGDMVAHTIKAKAATMGRYDINIKTITSSRGKRVRAEPVSALYKSGRIHHATRMANLEKQMVRFKGDGDPKEKSPDRLDALVFAITELSIFQNRELTVRWV